MLLTAACTDVAKIGALCPEGCVLTPARDCECDVPAAGGSAGAGSLPALDAAVGGGADDPAEEGAGCAAAPARGNLVVAMDASASLVPWWPALSEGFARFIEEDATRGLGVGLLGSSEACDSASYLPPLVPLSQLPGNLAALQAAIPMVTAATTSTVPVLSAAVQYAKDWSSMHPDSKSPVAVLLISDASPGVCDGLIGMYEAELSRIASEAFAGTPSIATYAIGGDSLPNIGPLASAGGTQAIMIQPLSTSDDVLDALRTIRSTLSASACATPP